MLALLLILTAVALVGLKPWAADSLTPGLTISPGIGAAVDDSTVVSRARPFGVADARVALAGPPAVDVAEPVAVSAPTEAEGRPNPVLAVARARPLGGDTAAPVSSPPVSKPSPAPEPVAVAPGPTPEPPVLPPAPSIVAGFGGLGGGSGTAAVGEPEPDESCEGDEYLVTITLDVGEVGEQSAADILIQRLEGDLVKSELRLEGDLEDVRDLVGMLVEEGNCVRVEVDLLPEGDPTQGAPETDTDAGELGETSETVVP